MPKFDDKAYRNGQDAFKKGATLRSIIELLIALDEKKVDGEDYEARMKREEKERDRHMSHAIGFADAMLTMLRGKL